MKLERLLINNFRNLEYFDINPSKSFNVIYGANGGGKTSVLEAISYLALARSFRGYNYQYLIKSGQKAFNIFAAVNDEKNDVAVNLGVSRSKGEQTKIVINGKSVKRLVDLIDNICVQIIHPQGIELVTEGPELRRNFIDWGVYYSDIEFKQLWFEYKKVLKNRNALLKSGASSDMILVWNEILVNLSEKIVVKRQYYIDLLKPILSEILSEFLPKFKLYFTHYKGWDKSAELRSLLELNLEKERVLGYTLYGCHRADLKIKSNTISAGATLSRGQLKLLVCAMRLAQGILLKRQTGINCIYLIDDLNSELDQNSQRILLSHLHDFDNQVFITNITKDTLLPTDAEINYVQLEDGNIKNI